MARPTVDTESLSYRVPPEERGYYELSIAIVRTAVDDYKKCLRRSLEGHRSADSLVTGLRTFFLSDVFENISGVSNPCDFLYKLDTQVEEEYRKGIRGKRVKSKHEVK